MYESVYKCVFKFAFESVYLCMTVSLYVCMYIKHITITIFSFMYSLSMDMGGNWVPPKWDGVLLDFWTMVPVWLPAILIF